jgi:benzylsuccinate CoA-transferase BbsF subunit
VCTWAIADKFLQEQLLPGTVHPLGNRSLDAVPHGCYPCAGNDQWCALSVDDDAQWARLVELIGDDRLRGPSWQTAEGRLTDVHAVDAALGVWTAQRSSAENVALLWAHGIPSSIIIDGASQARDTAMHASGFYVAVPHPSAGPRFATGQPFLLDGVRPAVRRAPLIGEHTEAVMLDVVGMAPLELSRLVAEGAVGS